MLGLYLFLGGLIIGAVAAVAVLYFIYRNNKCRFNAIEEIVKKGNLTPADILKISNIATGKETCTPCDSGTCG